MLDRSLPQSFRHGNGYNMAEKRETLEDLARREKDAEQERNDQRAEMLVSAERLAKEVPERFFQLATDLKQAVMRFNAAADPQKRLNWRESVSLAGRDPNPNADFNLAFGRTGAEILVALNALGRSGRPDVFLIEASGKIQEDGFMLRAEGFVKDKKAQYRISIDFKRTTWTIDELAERLVRCAVKASLSPLSE
jgi:hypothetical protein